MFKALITALLLIGYSSAATAQTSAQIAAYERATEAMRSGDWTAARQTAMGAGTVARDIIEWHYLRAGNGSFAEVQAFLDPGKARHQT